MPEKRAFRPRKRRSGFRDAKLIIIATEGAHTEPIYFNGLASSRYYYNPRIHVELLGRDETASSPEHVLQNLDKFRRVYKLGRHDELWLVLDVDQWGDAKLAAVAAQCQQKGYSLGVSNPCFELWLLLHLNSLDEYRPDTLDEFRENRKIGNRTRLEVELVALLGAYNKRNPDIDKFLPHVEAAIQRARALNANPERRWPNDLGSRVYVLAERIMDRNPTI